MDRDYSLMYEELYERLTFYNKKVGFQIITHTKVINFIITEQFKMYIMLCYK